MATSYACINYLRHAIPQNIADNCFKILKQSTQCDIIKVHDAYDFEYDIKIESVEHHNFYLNIYYNLLNALTQTDYDVYFLIEGDVEYSASHFTQGLLTLEKSAIKLACNKNLIQKNHYSFYKNHTYVRPLSSFCGTKQVLIQELQKKIDEFNQCNGVAWLEPSYDKHGECKCEDYESSESIYENRHVFSSTSLSSWEIRPKNNAQLTPVHQSKRKKINHKKIALFGILSNFEPMYSVTTCIIDQMNLISRHVDNFVIIVPSDFEEELKLPSNAEMRIIPRYFGDPTKDDLDKFNTFVNNCTIDLMEALRDIDVCIEHDGVFLESFMPYNAAIRAVIEQNPKIQWLHWVHSAPNLNPVPTEYPKTLLRAHLKNSKMVSINTTNKTMLAQMYSMPEEDVIFIPNIIDPIKTFNFHPLAAEIYYKEQLYNQDIICMYPARTVDAKQPNKIIQLLAAIKKQNKKVKFIYCNSYANAEQEVHYLNSLIELAKQCDFSDNFFATSTYLSEWCLENGHNIVLGVPHQVVLDLSKIADIFILPSISEGCSLIMLEAALNKNYIVLNDDLDTLFDFGGEKQNEYSSDKSFYINFGSIKKPFNNYIPTEIEWYQIKAQALLKDLEQQKSLNFFKFVRKYHSPEYIWDTYISPLIKN